MLKLALFFLIVSIIAGLFGFTGISAAAAGIAKILFVIFIVIFLVLLVVGLVIGSNFSSGDPNAVFAAVDQICRARSRRLEHRSEAARLRDSGRDVILLTVGDPGPADARCR